MSDMLPSDEATMYGRSTRKKPSTPDNRPNVPSYDPVLRGGSIGGTYGERLPTGPRGPAEGGMDRNLPSNVQKMLDSAPIDVPQEGSPQQIKTLWEKLFGTPPEENEEQPRRRIGRDLEGREPMSPQVRSRPSDGIPRPVLQAK